MGFRTCFRGFVLGVLARFSPDLDGFAYDKSKQSDSPVVGSWFGTTTKEGDHHISARSLTGKKNAAPHALSTRRVIYGAMGPVMVVGAPPDPSVAEHPSLHYSDQRYSKSLDPIELAAYVESVNSGALPPVGASPPPPFFFLCSFGCPTPPHNLHWRR